MIISEADFGITKSGEIVKKITVGNGKDLEFSILNRGATLSSFKIADKNGILDECILGFDNVLDYENHQSFYGATVGRVANRIANGKYEINGKEYNLTKNDNGHNCLHGGSIGFDKVIWKYTTFNDGGTAGVKLTYLSPDGEENFPGNLNVTVVFTLTDKREFIMDYTATTDKTTPVNLTNHAYWNLSGFKENIENHKLEIDADTYLPVDENLIPTGELKTVESTAFDFKVLKGLKGPLKSSGGFDHNFNLNGKKQKSPVNKILLSHPESGRYMEIKTTEPGVQLYTGFDKFDAICLETQMFPDAINQSHFESVLINPGEEYRQTTIHKIEIIK